MSVPGIVESRLDEEDVAAQISLSGGDEVFVTPTRTFVYRAEGLLSDESVEEYDHDAERLTVSEGRRKSTITYEYAVEDDRELTVPTSRLEEVLQPVLAGTLRAGGVTDADERIAQIYRFSELTLVITSERLLKHVGSAVWDREYESYHFEDVVDVDYEEGSVATQIVLRVDDGIQRIKTPNDEFPAVRRDLESALFAYRNVSSVDELSPGDEEGDEDEADDGDATDAVASLETGGIDPLSTGDTIDVEGDPLTEPDSREDAAGDAEEGDDGDPAEEGEDGAPVDATGGDAEGDEEVDGPETGDADGGEAGPDGDEGDGTDDPDAPDSDDDTGSDGDVATYDEEGSPVDADDAAEEVIAEWESPPDESEASFGGGFEPATGSDGALAEELSELRAAVERQNELLADQQRTISRLVEALREREASREDTD